MQVAILTDFVQHDPVYSLCRVVENQVAALAGLDDIHLKLLVRVGFSDYGVYSPAWVTTLDPGRIHENRVTLTVDSADEIDSLSRQMAQALADVDVVLTHDLIYQPNLWKYHVAARRVAITRPDLRWVHWVHSVTDLNVQKQMGEFGGEVDGRFPNSKIVAFHGEEVKRKAAMYGYESEDIVIVPSGIDFAADYDPVAKAVIREAGLWDADIVAIYPCRLDRGKQPHILIEIFAELAGRHKSHVVIVDFHSSGGDKATYRNEMKRMAAEQGVKVFFTSDIDAHGIPHKAVMDLMQFADVLVQPSMNEADSLVLAEAMWNRCGLVLNWDLPRFREFDGVVFGKFGSSINEDTGMLGGTRTEYSDYRHYMRDVASDMLKMLKKPEHRHHRRMRRERSLTAVGRRLQDVIFGGVVSHTSPLSALKKERYLSIKGSR